MTLSRWPSARRPEAAILIAFLRSMTASVLQSAAPSATAAAAVAERPAQHAHLLAVQAGHQVVIALRFGNAQHLLFEIDLVAVRRGLVGIVEPLGRPAVAFAARQPADVIRLGPPRGQARLRPPDRKGG